MNFNWGYPIEHPPNCFNFKPWTIAQACWGLIMDAVIWSLPHCVVWKLQLRYAHKIAISIVFALGFLNILVAVFRITSLLYVEYHGDLIHDIFPALVRAYMQTSTAIVLACCPLMRPVFEKLIPTKLTRIGTPPLRTNRLQSVRVTPMIRVTTRIDVHNDSSPTPIISGSLHAANQEPYGPVFEVQRKLNEMS
ncbi:hypothetical protein P280DRAFT_412354 [Massarina eburnea CBS 473.64]|uniref:Rhodopsin domain-containing protein n=1 Tax=Massarina eburnea CBS 473.64 TaxID=1395130 RepID=A0A6A6RIT1_9PLEO|nr:hypothetical protein P280DRAFT_412354 [Massarina eburnea CBS 473.64]